MHTSLFLLQIFLFIPLLAERVTISNRDVRWDQYENLVNAHDGGIYLFGDTYYMYGTVYGNCQQKGLWCDTLCGYKPNLFAVYSSKNLVNWTLENPNVVPEMAYDNMNYDYWEANVGYNEATKMYVMIFWTSQYGFLRDQPYIAVATSPNPTGPFGVQSPLKISAATSVSSTVGMFVDPDTNLAYVRYNTWSEPKRHILELLSDDWLQSTGQYSVILHKEDYPWYEGGGVFKYNDLYYAILGSDCCFCAWGSDVRVFVADTPLGTWQSWGQINFCDNGALPTPPPDFNMTWNSCDPTNPAGVHFEVPAQPFNVFMAKSKTGMIPVFFGEWYKSSPFGLKSSDLQPWIPLNIDPSTGRIQPMQWQDYWTIDLP